MRLITIDAELDKQEVTCLRFLKLKSGMVGK